LLLPLRPGIAAAYESDYKTAVQYNNQVVVDGLEQSAARIHSLRHQKIIKHIVKEIAQVKE
jgi:hypothetical protein